MKKEKLKIITFNKVATKELQKIKGDYKPPWPLLKMGQWFAGYILKDAGTV